jgi:uncharacterized repeat protein (TIGR01451 family)
VKIVWVPQTGGEDIVLADVYADDLTWEDANFDNNVAVLKLDVKQPVSDLGISITDGTDPIAGGSNETYTITVTNQGFDAATGVQVLDALPDNATFVSATGKGFTCSPAAVVTCTLKGTLAPGASVTITLVATLSGGVTATNTVSVGSTSLDPDPTDNTASVQTLITIV